MLRATEPFSIFAVTAPGLEPLAAAELARLGVRAVVSPGGVSWAGDREQLYDANLRLRTASRVLVRIGEFRARTFHELERHAQRLPWERYLSAGRPIRLRVSCRKSRLYHEGAVAERLLKAIQERSGAVGEEHAADAAGPDVEAESGGAQLLVVRFHRDNCTVSVDSSGALLHVRGYRLAVAKAPLRETLAAAMLLASGWRCGAPLVDPMCGSGTIAIEAALLARRIAPGLAGGGLRPREFAFVHWPDHDRDLWERLTLRARQEVRDHLQIPITASDRDAGAVDAARANAARAGVAADLTFATAPLSALEPRVETGWLITNPPYGVRVGEEARLRDLYAALGNLLRRRLPGWRVALLAANPRLAAHTGIALEERLQTRNGGIPVRLLVGAAPA